MPQECFILDNYHRLVLTYCIRFQAIAQKNGVEHAPIELLHGDFLESDAVKTAMASAGVVYMNNPRFGAELNLKVLGMHLLCQYTIKVVDSFLTEQLCPSMPKGCKLVISSHKSHQIHLLIH